MTTFALSVLNDAPDSIVLSAAGATTRVQVAKLGKFKDPRYGNFSITLEHFAKWKQNFLTLHRSEGKLGMPVDRDHLPEKRGETEAVGWITKLDNMGQDGKTSTPDELWATVEFNSLGQELVKDKRYAYISPTYSPNYADETGQTYGTTMVGVALTNRPFLDMACISLSHAGTATLEAEVEPVLDSPRQMPDLTVTPELLTALGVADDAAKLILDAADPAAALVAATAAKPTPTPPADPGKIDLKTLAQEQGLVVIDATTLTSLTAQAASGAAVAEELKATKFETGFNAAVDKGSVLPAAKETFKLAYTHDPEGTLKMLTDLPAVVSIRPQGSGASATIPAGASTLARESEGDWEVDNDRDEIHRKAVALTQETAGLSYDDALDRVLESI